jgi:hypothetical protein
MPDYELLPSSRACRGAHAQHITGSLLSSLPHTSPSSLKHTLLFAFRQFLFYFAGAFLILSVAALAFADD